MLKDLSAAFGCEDMGDLLAIQPVSYVLNHMLLGLSEGLVVDLTHKLGVKSRCIHLLDTFVVGTFRYRVFVSLCFVILRDERPPLVCISEQFFAPSFDKFFNLLCDVVEPLRDIFSERRVVDLNRLTLPARLLHLLILF